MNTVSRTLVSVVVSVVVFLAVGVGVTAGVEPWVEFSVFVGVPVGVAAGVAALFAVWVELWRRAVQSAGTDAAVVARWRGSSLAALVGVAVATALGVFAFFVVDSTLGIGLLVFGVPVTLLLAAVGGYVLAGRRSGSTPKKGSFSG
ncbi:hypothetical protein [Haloarchaeobius sp. DFWS5]|uniref:hypothetical protein n=1 Tax=Haloarchaeobius sp. DFWS5 TaxID=3446114 RepID=UPI003EBD14FD